MHIDIGSIPNIAKRLNTKEIADINRIFIEDPTISVEIEKMDSKKKIHTIWSAILRIIIIAMILSIASSIGPGDTFFGVVIFGNSEPVGGEYAGIFMLGLFLYMLIVPWVYPSISIPLQGGLTERYMQILGSQLGSLFQYSRDNKYGFSTRELPYTIYGEEEISYSTQFRIDNIVTSTMDFRHRRPRDIWDHRFEAKIIFENTKTYLGTSLRLMPRKGYYFFGLRGDALFFATIFGCGIWLILHISLGILIGYIIYRLIAYGRDTINLENMGFEELFDVQSEDQITSRMILTPALMDHMVQFAKRSHNQYYFNFIGNLLYISRIVPNNYMEISIDKTPIENIESIVQLYIDMKEIILLIKSMDLTYIPKRAIPNSIIQV